MLQTSRRTLIKSTAAGVALTALGGATHAFGQDGDSEEFADVAHDWLVEQGMIDGES